jgi:glycerol-3-phosphate acyltransferase PlsY
LHNFSSQIPRKFCEIASLGHEFGSFPLFEGGKEMKNH